MILEKQRKSSVEKALEINLNEKIYGSIAEIGAGQEVARNFFIAGGAAGTIAKTMSAYDMQFSDAIYGKEKNNRYVSQSRVNQMLDREYSLVLERLESHRPENTTFFSFANTMAARSYKDDRPCHGWIGIKFQTRPLENANKITLHVRLKDSTNLQQQEAVGHLGINLIYAAFYYNNDAEKAIETLMENLSTSNIEIDMIKFEGPHFKDTDDRLMALHLVKSGLTHSVFFTNKGEPVEGCDLLYNKNVIALRGSFRPFTLVHSDILNCAKNSFIHRNNFNSSDVIVLTELSMSHLLAFGGLDKSDFLGRVDTLCSMGYDVQISDFTHFYELKKQLTQFTRQRISIALGIKNIAEIFSPENYTNLSGGIIEGLGVLFSHNTKLFVYPKLLKSGIVRILNEMTFENQIKHLFNYFFESGRLIPITDNNPDIIGIFTKDIRDSMEKNDKEWSLKIPGKVYDIIKKRNLFGYISR